MNTETGDFLSMLRFLHYLRKYFVILILSAGLISFLAYNYLDFKKQYTSSARFIFNNLSGTNTPETVGTDSDLRALRSNSMQLFFSTEVISNLMERFDLYSCYHVTKDSILGREQLMKAIRASIQFKVDKIGGHELIVTTSDANMSAVIANTLIEETDKLNIKLLKEEAMRKVGIIDNLIQLSGKNGGQNNLNGDNLLTFLQQNMGTTTRIRDYYDVLLKSYLSENFHFFYVVALAVPDYKNYSNQNISIATALGIVITIIIAMMIYYVQRQLSQVRALGLYPEKAKVPSGAVAQSGIPDLPEPAISYEAKVT